MVANCIKILYKLHFSIRYATFLAFLRQGDSRGLVRQEPFLLYILFRRSTLVVQLLQYSKAIQYNKLLQYSRAIYKLNNNCKTNIDNMDKKKCIIDKYGTVYGFNLFVIINPDKSVVDKRFSFRADDTSIIDDEWSDYTAYTVRGAYDKEANDDCEIIVINRMNNPAEDINTFAHESFHAAVDILEACHIKLTEDTNEVFAYLIGYFTECVNKTASKR